MLKISSILITFTKLCSVAVKSESLWLQWTVALQLLCPCILQVRIVEWVAIFNSRDFPNPGIELTSLVSPALAGGFPLRHLGSLYQITILRKPVSLLHVLTEGSASSSEMIFNQYLHCVNVPAAWLSAKALPKTWALSSWGEFSLSYRVQVFNHFMSTQYHCEPWEA